ncbi:hypothetical protein KFE98_07590 [bacterium SCSIO 12741]|nr:hypothetical protein KFE98_07590 [bacterium SCSIO 12741]
MNIEGLNGSTSGDVQISIAMSGFTFSWEEKTKTTTKNEVKTVQYYYIITAYHPMTVITRDANGLAVAEYNIPALDQPMTQNTRMYSSKGSLEKYWKTGKNSFLESMDKKLMDRNVDIISAHLNDMHGKPQTKRSAKIITVKDKKVDYSEYSWAFEKAFAGYHSILSSPEEAKTNLSEAVKIWEEALKEVDPDNKKARINKKVAAATHFNCAEAYCWLNDYSKALYHMTKIKTYDVKKYEKQIASLKAFIDDHKARYEANN